MNPDAVTSPWDAAEVLTTAEAQEEFMIAAFETDDPQFIAKALGIVARARNMSQLARDTGLTRAALYRAFQGKTKPEFGTILKILRAMNIGLVPVTRKADEPA